MTDTRYILGQFLPRAQEVQGTGRAVIAIRRANVYPAAEYTTAAGATTGCWVLALETFSVVTRRLPAAVFKGRYPCGKPGKDPGRQATWSRESR